MAQRSCSPLYHLYRLRFVWYRPSTQLGPCGSQAAQLTATERVLASGDSVHCTVNAQDGLGRQQRSFSERRLKRFSTLWLETQHGIAECFAGGREEGTETSEAKFEGRVGRKDLSGGNFERHYIRLFGFEIETDDLN